MKTKKDASNVTLLLLKLVLLVFLLIVVTEGVVYSYKFGHAIFTDEAMTENGKKEDVEVLILQGASAKKVGQQLEDAGVVSDGTLFYFQAILSGKTEGFEGGKFVLNSSMKPSRILEVLDRSDEQE